MNGRPWFDWYAWHNKYWGTKWNAYDGYTIIGKTNITFVFSTAWNAPAGIYTELKKMYPDVKMEVRFADEDYGSNCAKAVHNPGEDFWEITWEKDLKNPVRFARDLWATY